MCIHQKAFDSMNPTPLTFAPILKSKVWGGTGLAGFGKDLGTMQTVGESWELADLPDSIPEGRSIVAEGLLAGKTLHALLEEDPSWIMGDARLSDQGGFPLLIKYLDARENLSMQVHPDEAWVAAHPGDHLKTESWIVLHAEPGAVLYKGVRDGVTPERFAAAIDDGTVVELVESVPARVGDCHDLPSGTCHALGAGILVAEIQTPSDTTFRVFDWGRTDRTLHVEQALHCIDFQSVTPTTPPSTFERDGVRITELSRTDHYWIDRIETTAPSTVRLGSGRAPEVLMMLSGDGTLGPDISVGAGRTALLPAALGPIEAAFSAGASMLRVMLPQRD
ncbi:MAG TPA: mannose-6-phosphate isomerase [Phycisphaerales bacterium]|nr:mannose-6-phosphate isomerase [Phycisphaerales bacterium]